MKLNRLVWLFLFLAAGIAAAQQPASDWEPVESKPRFDWDYWEFIAIAVTVAGFLIALAVFIFSSLIRNVRRMKVSVSKLIILLGAIAFLLSGLFPPWLSISREGHTRSADYRFIFSSPPEERGIYGTRLDISRLAVEWLCIVVATGTVWLLVSKPKKATGNGQEKPDKPDKP